VPIHDYEIPMRISFEITAKYLRGRWQKARAGYSIFMLTIFFDIQAIQIFKGILGSRVGNEI
jgi:hypothetical protein